jgi:hypothetical protein
MRLFPLSHCCLLLCLLSACATGRLPGDVQKFVERRDICDHLRGEAGDYNGDLEREKEINDGIAKFCTGTDKELALLRMKHVENQPVLEMLSKYMTRIEIKRK